MASRMIPSSANVPIAVDHRKSASDGVGLASAKCAQ
jgi:hypothetical protein